MESHTCRLIYFILFFTLSEACQHMGIIQKEEIMRWLRKWPNAGAGKSA